MEAKQLTWTELRRQELDTAGKVVRYRTHLSREEYNELMFNTGTAFATCFALQYPHVKGLSTKLLTDTKYGFWAWWRMKWAMDDYALLAKECICEFDYPAMKITMVGDPLFETELHYLLANLL